MPESASSSISASLWVTCFCAWLGASSGSFSRGVSSLIDQFVLLVEARTRSDGLDPKFGSRGSGARASYDGSGRPPADRVILAAGRPPHRGKPASVLRRAAAQPPACTGTLPAALSPFSGRAELQQLDGVEVLDAAADALGRVEQHIGLGRIGVAQHAHAGRGRPPDSRARNRRRRSAWRRSRCRACPRPRPAGSPSAWRGCRARPAAATDSCPGRP